MIVIEDVDPILFKDACEFKICCQNEALSGGKVADGCVGEAKTRKYIGLAKLFGWLIALIHFGEELCEEDAARLGMLSLQLVGMIRDFGKNVWCCEEPLKTAQNSQQQIVILRRETLILSSSEILNKISVNLPNNKKQQNVGVNQDSLVAVSLYQLRWVFSPHSAERIFIATTLPVRASTLNTLYLL